MRHTYSHLRNDLNEFPKTNKYIEHIFITLCHDLYLKYAVSLKPFQDTLGMKVGWKIFLQNSHLGNPDISNCFLSLLQQNQRLWNLKHLQDTAKTLQTIEPVDF